MMTQMTYKIYYHGNPKFPFYFLAASPTHLFRFFRNGKKFLGVARAQGASIATSPNAYAEA